MFEKRCSLCGGKLQHNICTECGLDNSKNDDNYISGGKVHKENESLTHEHKGNENPLAGKTVTKDFAKNVKKAQKYQEKQKTQTYQTGTYQSSTYQTSKTKQKKKGSLLSKIILIIIILSVVMSILSVIVEEIAVNTMSTPEWESEVWESYEETDPYAYVTRELSETGDAYETELAAGVYKGGVHIPEGTYIVQYTAELGNEEESYVELTLTDDENGIYERYEFSEDELEELEDLRIYTGGVIELEGRGALFFISENAQTASMHFIPNPNSESYTVSEEFEVGVDVQPGVYDVVCSSGSGIFDYSIDHKDGYEYYCGKLMGDQRSGFAGEVKNVVLPQGTRVEISGMTVELHPSEIIESSDYQGFYDNY